MARTALEDRRQILDELATAIDQLALAVACLSEAFELLAVDAADRLPGVACGSGLAVELARLRGASCSGIDASARLAAVAVDRNPECGIRVGDMRALPWDPASFDVVTSFRGIWGTTPAAVAEIHRGPSPGRTRRDNGVGSPEDFPGSLGAGAVPPGCGGNGRQPGCDGVARPAWCG